MPATAVAYNAGMELIILLLLLLPGLGFLFFVVGTLIKHRRDTFDQPGDAKSDE